MNTPTNNQVKQLNQAENNKTATNQPTSSTAVNSQGKIFSVVDMWNIQRQRKSFYRRSVA